MYLENFNQADEGQTSLFIFNNEDFFFLSVFKLTSIFVHVSMATHGKGSWTDRSAEQLLHLRELHGLISRVNSSSHPENWASGLQCF